MKQCLELLGDSKRKLLNYLNTRVLKTGTNKSKKYTKKKITMDKE